MSTVRVSKRKRYAIVDGGALEDSRLSYKALGLLTYLLGKTDDWEANISHLSSVRSDGETSVSSGLDELIEHGYAERKCIRDENGRVKRWETVVYEQSTDPEEKDDDQDQGEPDRENPDLDDDPQLNTELHNTDDTKTTTSAHEQDNDVDTGGYDTEPIDSHGRDQVDESDSFDQPKFLKAWEDLHGERVITHTPFGNDDQRQKALNHIRRYWTREEVRTAFGHTKGKDRPWAYFLRMLEIIASGEYDDGSAGTSDIETGWEREW